MKQNKTKQEKKLITIDITEWYDRLKSIAANEVRTVEEQARYFIKKGIDGNNSISYVTTYPTNPTYPSLTHPWTGDGLISVSNASETIVPPNTTYYGCSCDSDASTVKKLEPINE